MEFYSHPGRLLSEHLSQVRNYSVVYGKKEFEKIHEIVAYAHDFGKYTTFFQDRLFEREMKETQEGNHAHISAIFCAFTLINNRIGEDYLPLVAYSAVLSHHSRVKNLYNYIPMYISRNRIKESDQMYLKLNTLNHQKENIKNNFDFIYKDYSSFNLGETFRLFLENENSIEDTLIKLKKKASQLFLSGGNKELYWTHQQIFSALISSDKISASGIKPFEQKFIEFNELENIKRSSFSKAEKNQINDLRNNIYNIVQNEVEKNTDKKIFSITAPTGSGKTITGLFAAIKLKKINKDLNKIIYVLPYTSIIDQNYEDIRNLYKEHPDFSGKEYQYIIKHHHLSSYEKDKSNEIYDESEYQTFMENWESGTIITTFVQFLETVLGAKNKMLKKFHKLRDSIILMDEIQAVDIKYFKLLDYVFEKLSETLNCHIIIMTATKPLFFPDVTELLVGGEQYFKIINRTKIIPHIGINMTIKGFTDYFIQNIEDKSYMIVVNTINQSLEIFDIINGAIDLLNKYNHQVLYLSTNLIPKHRGERIEEIKEKLDKGERLILISTQVVEAGVNLDFDQVYRDISPLDSIIQCAGRCNRNNRGFVGNVNVVKMVDNNGKSYGQKVYGAVVLDIVEEILSESSEIEEKDYLELINKYYEHIKVRKSQQTSDNFIKSIENLNFDENDEFEIGKFSLIGDNKGYLDIFIEYDEEARKVLNNYKGAYKISDINTRKKELISLKIKLSKYVISMPEKYWSKATTINLTSNYKLLYIPREGIKDYYDDMKGFVREEKDSSLFF